MKHFIVLSAVVAMFASSSFAQNWGWGESFKPVITDNGLSLTVPISGWQRTDAPADKDHSMSAKRFPANAPVVICIYYAYVDEKNNTQYGEQKIKTSIDWNNNSATVNTGINLPSTATFTVVAKVPGYNKSEGESVFIRQEDTYAKKDRAGNPVYQFVGDFANKRVSKYNG